MSYCHSLPINPVFYMIDPSVVLFHLSCFFLMLRPPPISTLFPTRRSSDLPPRWAARSSASRCRTRTSCRCGTGARSTSRSEEHTSELQSLTNLVCRLLLEKKKERIQEQVQVIVGMDGEQQ